jgi:anti-anti-sigma factor
MLDVDLGSGEYGGYTVVALPGELDVMDAADVADALEAVAAREPWIIVDLAGPAFIDASGVAALMRGRRRARDAGGDLSDSVDVATIGILQERAVRHQEVVTGQLQVALNSRVIIEQAKGVLAERLRVTPDEAFVILRRYARDHNHPLTELSGDVIRGTARIAGNG